MSTAPNELANFLSILGATGRTVTVEDTTGQSHTLSTVLPARKQLEVAAAFDEALDDETIRGAFNAIQEVSNETKGDQILALIRFARLILKAQNRDRVLDLLDRLVAKAHPGLSAPASDHFELQEVLRMLLPFASRLLSAVSTAGRSEAVAEA